MTVLSKEDLVAENVAGVVKWFHVRDGIGFIVSPEASEDVFVHYSDIIVEDNKFRTLYEAQNVTFDLYKTHKGYQALGVAVASMVAA